MDVDDNQGSSSKKRVHYKSYDPSMMEKAMAAVQHDGKTMYRAAKDCGVPMNTLRDRLIAKGLFKPKRPVVYHERRAAAKRKRLSKERSRPHIIMDDDMVERWRDIGRSEGLTSNAAITRFLVSLYYRAGKQEELKSDIRCQQCHNPLTLFCVNCHLISPSTPTSKAAHSEMAADKDHLSVTGRQSPPSKSALPPQADRDIKTEGGHQPTPSEGRSLRRKRLTRSCEKSKRPVEEVFSSEDEQPGSDEEDNFADDGWPQIEETLRVEDSNDNKEDPSYSLDDFLTSFEEQTRKKPRIKNHECPQCGETFLDILCLKNHFEETKHISEYICKQCDKPFKNKSALQQHGRVHNRQEHQCSICGLSFKFPSRLNKHIKTHGTDKPHICEKCGKSFVSVYYLRDHIKIHSEERRYKCDQCGAAFKQKPALYAHGKKHTNERPFQCQYCGLKFRDSQKVKIHVRTHTGEKPYKCDMCDASFVSNSNMWQHCAYVHGKSTKSHQCPRCPLTFAAKGKLKVHMKNAHGGSSNEMSDGDATSCQYEMMRQTVQSMYIEIPGTNQLVQI